jgi:putative transposase
LRELERYIALDIVGSYHHSIHASLGRPPIAVWREHEDVIPLRLPQGRMRFWLTFLPEQERTLRPTGIHLFGLRCGFRREAGRHSDQYPATVPI